MVAPWGTIKKRRIIFAPKIDAEDFPDSAKTIIYKECEEDFCIEYQYSKLKN